MSEQLKKSTVSVDDKWELELRINYVGKYVEFEEDDHYGVPQGKQFVVLTMSCDMYGHHDTVVAIMIFRNNLFEVYNMV